MQPDIRRHFSGNSEFALQDYFSQEIPLSFCQVRLLHAQDVFQVPAQRSFGRELQEDLGLCQQVSRLPYKAYFQQAEWLKQRLCYHDVLPFCHLQKASFLWR